MTNPRFEPEGKGELTGGITPVYPLSAGISQNFLLSLLRTALPACLDQIEAPLPPALRAEHHLIDAPRPTGPSTFPPPGRTCKQPAAA